MKRYLLGLVFAPTLLFPVSDGFGSLMPKKRIDEARTAENAPANVWSLRDGIIYRNFILRAEGTIRGSFVTDRPPLGLWDKYEITAREGRVLVVRNGKLVNEGRHAIPSEGRPVPYCNVSVRGLEK